MPDREQLTAYIENSRRAQRGAVSFGLVIVAIAFVALLAGAGFGVFVALGLIGGAIAGAGVWITAGHIDDFKKQLR
jgi:hypothetical protein